MITMEDSAFCKSVAAVSHSVTTPRATGYNPLRSSTQFNSNNSKETQNGKTQRQMNHVGPRRLTPAEVAEKKRLRLCYKCDATWSKRHECRFMELRVLTVIDGCEVEILNEEWNDTFEDENGIVTELMELSLAPFLGLSSPTTTKLWDCIGKTKIVIMIDSGATHNFLDPSVVKKINVRPV